jgi:hypothetical protein
MVKKEFIKGELYIYIPNIGLQKLNLTVPELVNLSPFQSHIDKSIYLSNKKTTAILIDPISGNFNYELGKILCKYSKNKEFECPIIK